ncbi:hypothetical protein SAMN04488111_1288 [Lutibacter flavus]|uniref:Uncharacterized protein n=1 Tax=Lutibacter flavus TaxID=691689 RepID=A0A238WWC4_9FLAO|nr:hypothetical protein SAMN04488111_1288 [Lutibacter flavus]
MIIISLIYNGDIFSLKVKNHLNTFFFMAFFNKTIDFTIFDKKKREVLLVLFY